MSKPIQKSKPASPAATRDYSGLLGGISELLEAARRASARTVNAFMTATYWEVGRRIVEFEQGGEKRAVYGESLLLRLADDLTARFGKGFGKSNLFLMRKFYLASTQIFQTASGKLKGSSSGSQIFQTLSGISVGEKRATRSLESGEATIAQTLSAKFAKPEICQTPSGKSADAIRSTPSSIFRAASGIFQTPSEKSVQPAFTLPDLARAFPLPWSQYVLLISRSRSPEAFAFYHAEALRGGWSVRQLRRQMDSQFYERTALSRNKAAMLAKGVKPRPGDAVSADEEIRHPLVLEFLGLRDEYSETDLEDALIRQLETFLLELGNDFAFVGRQRRLRIDDEWYRVDLLFFHRRLRCLVIFDLKLGRFTHADAGQMHLYLNYAREHWVQPGENPPVGVILCSSKSEALVRYATDALPNKLLVREYLTTLPDEKVLAAELEKTRKQLESRK
jgi:predicted nuclease of restriction endonuclease-like (RecB) superfamily